MERPWIAIAVGLAVAALLWLVRGGDAQPSSAANDGARASQPAAAARGKVGTPRPAGRALAPLEAVYVAPRVRRPGERSSAHRARMRLLDQLQARTAGLDAAARQRVWAVLADAQESYGDPEATCAPRGEREPTYDQAQCLANLLDVLADEVRDRLFGEVGALAESFDEGFVRSIVISGRLGLFDHR